MALRLLLDSLAPSTSPKEGDRRRLGPLGPWDRLRPGRTQRFLRSWDPHHLAQVWSVAPSSEDAWPTRSAPEASSDFRIQGPDPILFDKGQGP